MNEVLQVTKIVLLLEQCVFIVKQYYETHSLKHVRNDFMQEFPNFVSPSNHATLNLIFLTLGGPCRCTRLTVRFNVKRLCQGVENASFCHSKQSPSPATPSGDDANFHYAFLLQSTFLT